MQLYDLAQAGRWDEAVALQERLPLAFYEVIGQAGPHASVMSSAVGGFKSALKAKGIITSTRVAEALHRHGFL